MLKCSGKKYDVKVKHTNISVLMDIGCTAIQKHKHSK